MTLSKCNARIALVYKFKKKKKKKKTGRADFSDQFRKIIVRYKIIGYNINIM